MGDIPTTNGHGPQSDSDGSSTNFTVKAGLAKMLKGGVIMDVINAEQVRDMQKNRRHYKSQEAAANLVFSMHRHVWRRKQVPARSWRSNVYPQIFGHRVV